MSRNPEVDLIREAYLAMPKEWLRRALLVEYRCPNRRRCLLLHAWGGADGTKFYFVPDYKLSSNRNAERTVEPARAKNTLDGDRHWMPRAGSLENLREFGPSVGLDLQCDHLSPVVVTADQVLEDARHAVDGHPLVRLISAERR